MNDDERFLKDWLDDDAPDPAAARKDADQIMARLPQIKQRSRWWPLLLARRSRPRPSSGGQAPTINERTRIMFSPVKAITASALIFTIGGAFLIAQPFDQQGSVPGAEAEAVAPTRVTGDIRFAPGGCSRPESSEMDGDVLRVRNIECSPQTWTSSDPRLTAEVSRRYSEDTYQTEDGAISVGTDTADLRNAGGGWACSTISLLEGSGSSSQRVTGDTVTCTGDGGYAGLSAILIIEQVGRSESFYGLIFSGEVPPLPEPPAAE